MRHAARHCYPIKASVGPAGFEDRDLDTTPGESPRPRRRLIRRVAWAARRTFGTGVGDSRPRRSMPGLCDSFRTLTNPACQPGPHNHRHSPMAWPRTLAKKPPIGAEASRSPLPLEVTPTLRNIRAIPLQFHAGGRSPAAWTIFRCSLGKHVWDGSPPISARRCGCGCSHLVDGLNAEPGESCPTAPGDDRVSSSSRVDHETRM